MPVSLLKSSTHLQNIDDVTALVKSVEGTIRQLANSVSHGLSRADYEDLCAAGRMGAIKAANRYDADHAKGASFNSYATLWIRSHRMNEVFYFWSNGRVRLGNKTSKIFYRYGRTQQKLAANGIDPTPELIAEELGVSLEVLQNVSSAVQKVESPENIEAIDESTNALVLL
jgi:RNA polymerase sigma-32 factor